MTIAPLYKCPSCGKNQVAQVPLGLFEAGELKRAYVQHVCWNCECNHRKIEPAELRKEVKGAS